jgi:hypothetical protein
MNLPKEFVFYLFGVASTAWLTMWGFIGYKWGAELFFLGILMMAASIFYLYLYQLI